MCGLVWPGLALAWSGLSWRGLALTALAASACSVAKRFGFGRTD